VKDQLIIFTDGGSRGNPGQAACAFVVLNNNNIVFQDAHTIGVTTNNVAEYYGVIKALNWLLKYQPLVQNQAIDSLVFKLDSLLVVNQLIGKFKIKNKDLMNLVLQIKELEQKIPVKIIYLHVSRSRNNIADSLLNLALDQLSVRTTV
jgi:ribonuclease HI